jgi:CTP:phosphocholine cytidylyltransferase-like protein
MKVVILAGGFGTRISEESHLKPKPMIEIGNEPILIHLMKYYASYGFDDFIICLGYKGYAIKEYFNNLHLHHSDVLFDFSDNGKKTYFNSKTYKWKVKTISSNYSLVWTKWKTTSKANSMQKFGQRSNKDGCIDSSKACTENSSKPPQKHQSSWSNTHKKVRS